MYRFKTIKAFTLSEILVTLAIIGIVISMTMGVVVGNSQKQQMITQLKKSYSTVQQALKLSEVQNGIPQNWVYGANETDITGTNAFAETYIVPFFIKLEAKKNADGNLKLFLNDGVSLTFLPHVVQMGNAAKSTVKIEMDINGVKGGSVAGRDVFYLIIEPVTGKLLFWGEELGTNRDYIISNGCSRTGNKDMCGALIRLDGWKVLKDYPW